MKKTIWPLLTVALVVSIAVWMLFNAGPNHIEDTNGPDNFALQQITEENIVNQDIGARGGLSKETFWNAGNIGGPLSGVKYFSSKFTGVQVLYTCTILEGSDIHVYLTGFHVESGNFAFYVVLDGEIVGEVKPDEFGIGEFILEDIEKTGTLEYIVAGESANLWFSIPQAWV